jgi:hypothetical protein
MTLQSYFFIYFRKIFNKTSKVWKKHLKCVFNIINTKTKPKKAHFCVIIFLRHNNKKETGWFKRKEKKK